MTFYHDDERLQPPAETWGKHARRWVQVKNPGAIEGWQWILAAIAAVEAFPEAAWVAVGDSDTYWFTQGLEHFAATRDPAALRAYSGPEISRQWREEPQPQYHLCWGEAGPPDQWEGVDPGLGQWLGGVWRVRPSSFDAYLGENPTEAGHYPWIHGGQGFIMPRALALELKWRRAWEGWDFEGPIDVPMSCKIVAAGGALEALDLSELQFRNVCQDIGMNEGWLSDIYLRGTDGGPGGGGDSLASGRGDALGAAVAGLPLISCHCHKYQADGGNDIVQEEFQSERCGGDGTFSGEMRRIHWTLDAEVASRPGLPEEVRQRVHLTTGELRASVPWPRDAPAYPEPAATPAPPLPPPLPDAVLAEIAQIEAAPQAGGPGDAAELDDR